MAMEERAQRGSTRPALWLLAFMMAAGPFGDTEYTPAMPAMAHALDTGYGAVQLSMAAYLVAMAVSQLVFGPLSDRHGRRPVMLAGAGVLALGGLGLSRFSCKSWRSSFNQSAQRHRSVFTLDPLTGPLMA